MTDAHCHLSPDLATSSGRALVNATRQENWDAVIDAAERFPHVDAAVGIHPWYADQANADWERELRERLSKHPRLSLGEIGLDRSKGCAVDIETQKKIFERQLSIAQEFQRPVSVHCVRAWGALIEKVSVGLDIPVILHSIQCSMDVLRSAMRVSDVYASVSLRTLRSKGGEDLVRAIPEDRLLIETDYPEAPQQIQGNSRVEELRLVSEQVEALRGKAILDNYHKIWLVEQC